MKPTDFVNTYYNMAVNATKGSEVDPATLLTQAALETGWATSQLAQKANNFFGIKHFNKYPNRYGVYRKYDSVEDSFKDYVNFLETNSRYKTALIQDYVTRQLEEIAKAGYAEDPNYYNKLESIFFDYIQDPVLALQIKNKNNPDTQTASTGFFGKLLLAGLAWQLFKPKSKKNG